MALFARALERRASSPYTAAFLRGDDLPNAWGPNGTVVTESSALHASTVYACVSLVAETIATLPFHVFRRLENGGAERAVAHRAYRLLHDEPNPDMSSVSFWECLVGWLELWGNAYAQIVADTLGQPVALWPLRADRMGVERRDGRLVYRYRVGAEIVELDARSVLHLRLLSTDGVTGLSRVQLAALAIGQEMSAQAYGERLFWNNSRPGGIISVQGQLSPEAGERIKAVWESAHRGPNNAGRVAVLQEGATWQSVGMPPQDAQWIEARKLNKTEICGIYHVPPHKIGDLERATFANIEEQNIDWAVTGIRPRARRIEAEVQRQLLSGGEYYALLALDGLLRGNTQTRHQTYALGRQWGYYSVNDVRQLEDLNPVDNGDIYLQPLNMVEAGADSAARQPAATPGAASRMLEVRSGSDASRRRLGRAYRRLFYDAATRLVRRETAEVRAAAERLLNRRAESDFLLWLQDYYRDLPAAIERSFVALLLVYAEAIQADAAAEIGVAPGMTAEMEAFVRRYIESGAAAYAGRSLGQLRQQLRLAQEEQSDPLERVLERLDEWGEKRPDKVADLETNRAANAVTKETWRRHGVTILRWTTAGASCEFCNSLDGQIAHIERWFVEAGGSVDAGGGGKLSVSHNIGHAPLHLGCNCGIAPG